MTAGGGSVSDQAIPSPILHIHRDSGDGQPPGFYRRTIPLGLPVVGDAVQGEIRMSQGINVFALVKDGQRYVFLYDDKSHDELLQTLGRYAADPELNFSWYDAAVMSQRVRSLRKRIEEEDSLHYRESA